MCFTYLSFYNFEILGLVWNFVKIEIGGFGILSKLLCWGVFNYGNICNREPLLFVAKEYGNKCFCDSSGLILRNY